MHFRSEPRVKNLLLKSSLFRNELYRNIVEALFSAHLDPDFGDSVGKPRRRL
jgi:hypothetical protein